MNSEVQHKNHENFTRFVKLCENAMGNGLTPEDERIFVDAIHTLASGRAETLDEALGIGSRRGVAKVGYRLRKALRNRRLKQFMEDLRREGELNWSLATMMCNLMSSFQTRVWPRGSNESVPPQRLDESQTQLWWIFKIDHPPIAASALFSILEETPDFIE